MDVCAVEALTLSLVGGRVVVPVGGVVVVVDFCAVDDVVSVGLDG